MNSKYIVQWLVTFSLLISRAYLQIPMQIYQMPPLFALPAPLPIPLPQPPPPLPALSFQIAVPVANAKPSTTTTSTTTTERSVGIAFPVQLPFPVQVAIPAQPPPDFCLKRPRPYNCPVCPPCMCTPCTPAFFSFCSPCHQKCRCRDRNDVPEPLPHVAPVPVPGPAYPVAIPSPFVGPSSYIVPFHEKHKQSDGTYEADESRSDSCERTSNYRRRSKGRRSKSYRRNFKSPNSNDEDGLRPVLSYLTGDGVVKMEKPLSDAEAENLLDESLSQKVYVSVDEDSENRQRLHVESRRVNREQDATQPSNHRRRQVYLKAGSARHMLAEGKKQLVFTPPLDKKISNLSVSFQIT